MFHRNACPPRPSEFALIGNGVFVSVLKVRVQMRSYWIRVSRVSALPIGNIKSQKRHMGTYTGREAL